jgi:hypothetical protein
MTRKSFCSANSRIAIRAAVLAGTILLLCAGPAPVERAASAPDWLSAASRVDVGTLGAGNPAVVLGEWTDFSVDATGKFVETERRAMRILNLKLADRYLRAVGYENSDEGVVLMQAWSISSSGRVLQTEKKNLATEASYPGFVLFSDDRVKVLTIAGAEDGAVVGYEIVRSGRLPLAGEQFMLEGLLPVRLGEVHVSIPSGSLRWFVNHPDRVEVVSQSPNAAFFRSVNRPAIAQEEGAPPFQTVAAAVFVNYDPKGSAAVQSWEDASRAIHPLLSGAEKPAPEIATEVESLSAGQADLVSKLNAVYTFVSRQIRYVAVEIGIGGFQPHPAADVFQNKYGDCKDKATLLLTMLDHLGLRGYPALVGTRGDVEADPSVPTLATFDHMIVALPVSADLQPAVERFSSYDPQSHILWIDPTSEMDPLGQLPGMDQGVFALISYPDRGDLRRIPESPLGQNGAEYQATIQLGPDGAGAATVEEKYLGDANARRHSFYRNLSQDEMRRAFEERVDRYANQAAFRTASVTGTQDNSGQIVEKFSFAGAFGNASTGDSWFFQPLFLSGISVPEISPQPRVLPLELGSPYHVKGEYHIMLPAGMRISGVPASTSLKSDFGSLDVDYSANGNVVRANFLVSFTMSRVPPEKYDAFREFVNAVRRAGQVRLRAMMAP